MLIIVKSKLLAREYSKRRVYLDIIRVAEIFNGQHIFMSGSNCPCMDTVKITNKSVDIASTDD